MKSLRVQLLLIMLLCHSPVLLAAGLRPFVDGSLQDITATREGKPFLLALWSVDCPPCMKELKHLRQLREEYPALDVVLVSTDGSEDLETAQQVLESFDLDKGDNWIFADGYAERLRYGIDPAWFGELPRAYFYAIDHQRLAVSGALSLDRLRHWARQLQLPQTH